jgi:membrane protein DedA with SNARE-associated domain
VDQTATHDGPLAWLKRNLNWLALGFAFLFFVLPWISPFETLNQYLTLPRRGNEWALGRLEDLFADYGYVVVFVGVLMENSLFLGILVPGAVILILGGLSAENGDINLWLTLALAMVATYIGDTLSYLFGRLGWARALERTSMGPVIEKARAVLDANHTWIILGYHFAGYTRLVGPVAAGMFKIPYRRWAPLDYTGGTAWVIVFTTLGVALGLFGLDFGDTRRMARVLELVFTGLMVVGVGIAWYRTSRRAGRGEEAAGIALHPATVIVPVDDDRAG